MRIIYAHKFEASRSNEVARNDPAFRRNSHRQVTLQRTWDRAIIAALWMGEGD
jgi:hypothetical protein